ncbi:hypothetical protein BDQ17DRAFT_1401943 [Cyathus striatus]|nr:hypothetical protein BDQ17DRAFT_1401943 [Cyathus striatus]
MARWGPVRSLLALAPVLIAAPFLGWKIHYNLPDPITDLTNPLTSLPQISESNILNYTRHLSEEIGFRTVGTREHAHADAYMFQQITQIKRHCDEVVARNPGRKLECEVWRQEGSGSHRFDMMGKRLYKTYRHLSNFVVRLSNATPQGKEHSVLVNAHLDSTIPSPGAADDAISVGVMLDCIRVLVDTPGWEPEYSIVFLFNHAEESLQDGSHLFSTQHEVAPTVRAMINLEAAGTQGRELLFQATSEEMIEAYSHVPRPFGTIFANDVFGSGIMLSDTDFRQFEEYLNVTGLDMAIVGNSYLYHMRKDLVEHIEAGVAQNMGENALALLLHLSAPGSPLPSLTEGYTRPQTKPGVLGETKKAMCALGAASLGVVLVPNVVAWVMRDVLGHAMSWFSSPYAPVGLFVPPALFGLLLSQYLVGPIPERTAFTSILLLQFFLAFGIQMLGVGSAALFIVSAIPLFAVLIVNPLFASSPGEIALPTYVLGQAFPLLTGTLLMLPILDVFVPLTGRIGDTPADNIIGTAVAIISSLSFPLLFPFAHRFGRRVLKRAVWISALGVVVAMIYFVGREPYDAMHQKRLFVIHMENITSHEQHLHMSTGDGAPGFKELVHEIADEFARGEKGPDPVVMDDYNPDWDLLYPFSAFLAPYKVQLPVAQDYVSPWTAEKFSVKAVNDTVDLVGGTRKLTLRIDHPGLIWTVIAFDAHVLEWDLDNNPPDEYVRHHIKEASFYGVDTWDVNLTIKLSDNTAVEQEEGIKINYIGLQEGAVWPAKKHVKEQGGIAMGLFEKMDGWLEERTGGTVDALLIGCVAGVAYV